MRLLDTDEAGSITPQKLRVSGTLIDLALTNRAFVLDCTDSDLYAKKKDIILRINGATSFHGRIPDSGKLVVLYFVQSMDYDLYRKFRGKSAVIPDIAPVNSMEKQVMRELPVDSAVTVTNHIETSENSEPIVVTETPRVDFIQITDLFFELNKADLTEKSRTVLMDVKKYFDQKYLAIIVRGYTDTTGQEKYNLVLSEKRAAAVGSFIVDSFMADKNKMKIEGFGSKDPIGDNTTPDGRQKNRRVTIEIIKE